MPELPEVETVRRGLAPVLEGRKLLRVEQRRPDLRFPLPDDFPGRLKGVRVERLGRRAKFLTADLSSGDVLVMHLGMSGRFTIGGKDTASYVHATGGLEAHNHVVFHVEGGHVVTYNDPRRFGFMELWPKAEFETYPRLKDMGPEPLSNAFTAVYLGEAFFGKAAPVKAALLDQSVVAGLGNIYVCEALYRAGISPLRKAGAISAPRLTKLTAAINAVIAEAIDAGGSSISDFAATDGAPGYFQNRFDVYERGGAPCHVCGRAIRRVVQSGRSSYYCSQCQR